MASINYAAREISVKVVYYGPGLSGKTTNLQVIHRKVPPEYKSDMVSLATETDRTLFFDFLPLDLGKIKGFSTKFQLYTVPGQVYYNATRKLVLRGVDGVVFVADSAPDKIQENIESFQNLEENLAEYGYKRENIPIIIQYNKRDLPNALSIEELQHHINKYNLPWSEAVANKGKGVFDSLKLIGKIVIDYLNKKYSRQSRPASQDGYNQMPAQRPVSDNRSQFQPPQQPQAYQQVKNQQYPGGFGGFQPPIQQQPRPAQQYPANKPFPNQIPSTQPFQQQPMRPPIGQGQFRQPNMLQGGQMPAQPQQFRQPMQAPTRQTPLQQPPRMQPPMHQAPIQQPTRQQPPVRKAPQMPMANSYDQSQFQNIQQPIDSFDSNEVSFEPTQGFQSPSQPQNYSSGYYDYGNINFQTPAEQQQQTYPENQFQPESSPQFEVSGKTDLDLEIEKYQREIEEKQRRMRGQPPLQIKICSIRNRPFNH